MHTNFSVYISWGISLLATVVSLIFSEVLKYPPCSLCWYQRIFMYSLAIIIPVGIVIVDKKVSYYILALSLFGLGISGYHSLIYHEIIQEAFTVCTEDLSCKTKQFELFGVLSIPVMSFLSFIGLTLSSIVGIKNEKRN
jgi:disulfide bond formation protein DsbB